ncbi:MAG: hypothetical protein ACLTDI_12665 [Acutalibacteraceae bacterium]
MSVMDAMQASRHFLIFYLHILSSLSHDPSSLAQWVQDVSSNVNIFTAVPVLVNNNIAPWTLCTVGDSQSADVPLLSGKGGSLHPAWPGDQMACRCLKTEWLPAGISSHRTPRTVACHPISGWYGIPGNIDADFLPPAVEICI